MFSVSQIIFYIILILLVILFIYAYRIIMAGLKINKISPTYNKKWKELTKLEKSAFENLGWDSKTWDTIDKQKLKNYPKSYKKSFSKLTKEEKNAAKAIGHYSFSWWRQENPKSWHW